MGVLKVWDPLTSSWQPVTGLGDHAALAALDGDDYPRYLLADGSRALERSLTWPATQDPQADANTLDDYEEGSWTPAWTFSAPGSLSIAYAVQQGAYQKVGRWVHVQFALVSSTWSNGSASGALRLAGLPFAPDTLKATCSVETRGAMNIGTDHMDHTLEFAAGDTYGTFYLPRSSNYGPSTIPPAVITSNQSMAGNLSYLTAS